MFTLRTKGWVVQIADISVDFTRTSGPGPQTVVLLHPIGLDRSVWAAQTPVVGASCSIVSYDHRGHGRSPVPPGPYAMSDLGADLVALLDTLGLERAALCGISLGGMVALWVAAHHPDRVSKLFVACTSARPGRPEHWHSRAVLARERGMGAIVDQRPRSWFTPSFVREHPEVERTYESVLARTSPEGYAATCEALAGLDLVPELNLIRAPTTVLLGGKDYGFTLEHADRIVEGVEGARLVVLEEGAHLPNVERPTEFNAAVTRWVEDS